MIDLEKLGLAGSMHVSMAFIRQPLVFCPSQLANKAEPVTVKLLQFLSSLENVKTGPMHMHGRARSVPCPLRLLTTKGG